MVVLRSRIVLALTLFMLITPQISTALTRDMMPEITGIEDTDYYLFDIKEISSGTLTDPGKNNEFYLTLRLAVDGVKKSQPLTPTYGTPGAFPNERTACIKIKEGDCDFDVKFIFFILGKEINDKAYKLIDNSKETVKFKKESFKLELTLKESDGIDSWDWETPSEIIYLNEFPDYPKSIVLKDNETLAQARINLSQPTRIWPEPYCLPAQSDSVSKINSISKHDYFLFEWTKFDGGNLKDIIGSSEAYISVALKDIVSGQSVDLNLSNKQKTYITSHTLIFRNYEPISKSKPLIFFLRGEEILRAMEELNAQVSSKDTKKVYSLVLSLYESDDEFTNRSDFIETLEIPVDQFPVQRAIATIEHEESGANAELILSVPSVW